MRKPGRLALAACAVVLLACGASAEVTLNSVRVAAPDTVALAKFYQAAFGMLEVNRIPLPDGPEIFLNFGATPDAAKANRTPPVVIMHSDFKAAQDPIAHVIFTVTDITGTVAAIKAAGGKMAREPFEYGKTGIMIGIAVDPAGNQIELIQQPKR